MTIVRLAALAFAITFLSFPAYADDLPLKRVVITTSGLALYEHQGTITGDEDVGLSVRLDHVDDILKSLVVLDAKGQLGGVSLPGREPLSQAFRDLPFSQKDLDSPLSLLNALQGAEVQVSSGKETLTGKLMNVSEETQKTQDGIVTRHRVSVLTADGVRTVLLETLDRLQFTDKTVQDQLNRALAATFGNRIKDQRALKISLLGAGERPVSLAYIQEAPLWKSSYRLILPEKDGDKALLQGWAVMENTTGQDWHNVNVTLMSGSPVTYQQALYQSYYVPRPDLPVKVMDRILPRVDNGAMPVARDEMEMKTREAFRKDAGVNFAAGKMMAEHAAVPMAAPAMAGNMAVASDSVAQAVADEPMPMAQTMAAKADETASQLIFAFPQPVTLPAGNTLMIPFISHALPAEKLYLYQPETNAQHPLATIALTNDTGNGMPPGILTLFDQKSGLVHVGDAEMPMVPKAENRYISFALDTKTKIDSEQQEENRLGLITIAGGMLNQKMVTLDTTKYTIKAPEDEDRIIVIELPRQASWTLEKPQGAEGEPEMTATHFRVRVKAPKGQVKTLNLTLRHEDMQAIALTDIEPSDLDNRIAAVGKDMPPELRKVLDKVRELRLASYTAQQNLQRIQEEQQQIANDQQRLRENLRTVSPANDLGKRYLKEMNDQEDRLAALLQNQKDTQDKLREANAALSAYLQTVKL